MLSNLLQKYNSLILRDLCRASLNKFLAQHSTNDLVLDIGSMNQMYRALFPNAVSLDIQFGDKLDIMGDAHLLPFKDESFSCVTCTEVLEHCYAPNKAIDEMYRVLKKQGKLILTTRFVFPIHEAPHDYYRFTRYGLEKLLTNYSEIHIIEDTLAFETLAVILQRMAYQFEFIININYLFHILSKITYRLEFLINKHYGSRASKKEIENIMPSGYHVVAIK